MFFESDGDAEVQFFVAEFVVGIYEVCPLPQQHRHGSGY